MAWTSSSQQIVAAVTTDESAGGAILLSFDQDDLKEVDSLFPHCASCYYLEADRSQQVMALGSQDYCVTLWDLPAFECKRTLFIDAEIRSMSFSGDGKYLALATEDPSILIVSLSSHLSGLLIHSLLLSLTMLSARQKKGKLWQGFLVAPKLVL